jgi:hypothetical protein
MRRLNKSRVCLRSLTRVTLDLVPPWPKDLWKGVASQPFYVAWEKSREWRRGACPMWIFMSTLLVILLLLWTLTSGQACETNVRVMDRRPAALRAS